MARPSNRTERRGQILDALQRVMATHGYERATIALIAESAGLTPGLVHYHFTSKAEILLALVQELTTQAHARVESRLARAHTPHDRLDAILDALLSRGPGSRAEAVQCWALIGAEAVKSPDVREVYAAHVTQLTDQLADAVLSVCHADQRTGEGARAIAGALVALTEGYFALSAAVPSSIPAGSAASMARRTARGLIAAQPHRESV